MSRDLLRDREVKRGALAEFRLHPDPSAALLDDAFANRQSDSSAGELAAMQTFEDAKNLLVIPRIDSNAIVANGELNRVPSVDGRNMNVGRLRPAEPDRVHNQLPE